MGGKSKGKVRKERCREESGKKREGEKKIHGEARMMRFRAKAKEEGNNV